MFVPIATYYRFSHTGQVCSADYLPVPNDEKYDLEGYIFRDGLVIKIICALKWCQIIIKLTVLTIISFVKKVPEAKAPEKDFK